MEGETHRYEGPIRVDLNKSIDYPAMVVYLKKHPNELLEFTVDHLVDDNKREFVQELYDYINAPGELIPAFDGG
jgi:hypothetical protein